MTSRTVEAVLTDHTDRLMAIHGVVGVAQSLCSDRPCILVLATQITDAIRRQLPAQIEGYEIRLQVSGEIRALPLS